MEITKDIKYVGVNDHDVDLFEGQYVEEIAGRSISPMTKSLLHLFLQEKI